ncbi:MAG TPA: M56 family metallopeptidase [Thermoanaerobaculia bacterium]|nr:M56 family metallopeptidase [Thermoanaerobaculia bacterium]
MSELQNLLFGAAGRSIGWALIHLLWQACAVAALLACANLLLRGANAVFRYGAAVTALLAVTLMPVVTALQIDEPAAVARLASDPTVPLPVALEGIAGTPAPLGWAASLESKIDPLLPWVIGCWAAGVLFFTSRLSIGWLHLRRYRAEAVEPVEMRWHAMLERLRRKLRIGQEVRLLQSSRVDVPAVIGWLSPIILMPVNALAGLSPRQIETILAHELAHVRRDDYLVNLLQSIVETLFFYHPAVWWISNRVRAEREHCCDDIAVRLCGDARGYAEALTRLEELRADLIHTALAASGGSLLTRIRRLVGRESDRTEGFTLPVLISSVVAAALLTGVILFAAPESNADAGDPSGTGYQIRVIGDLEPPPPPELPSAPTAPDPPEIPGSPDLSALADLDFDLDFDFEMPELPPMPPMPQMAPMPPMPQMTPMPPMPPLAPFGFEWDEGFEWDAEIEEMSAAIAEAVASSAPMIARAEEIASHAAQIVGETNAWSGGSRNRELDAKKLDPANLDVDTLVRLRMAGVNPESIRAWRAAGFPGITLGELIRAHAAGLTPGEIDSLRSLTGESLTLTDLIRLKAAGVTRDFARQMQMAGLDQLKTHDLIRLSAAGVTPEFIRGMQEAGYSGLSASDLVRLSAAGVNPQYIGGMRQAGYTRLSATDLVRLSASGVTPKFVQEMRQAGLRDLGAVDLVRLRSAGVSTDFVQEMSEAGLKDLSPDDLIRLRFSGIDGDYIRKMKAMEP